MSPVKTRKPTLSERFLRRHNITLYEDGDEDIARLPPHVRRVKNKLLNFLPLPSDFEGQFDENLKELRRHNRQNFIKLWGSDEQEQFHSVSLKPRDDMYCNPDHDLGLFGKVRRTAQADLERSEKIAEQAIELLKSSESSWMQLYREELFKTFMCTLDQDLKGMSKFVEQWSFNDKRPKPDITYAFPVLEFDKDSLPSWSPEYSDNFSFDFLKQAKLRCLATDKIRKGRKSLRQHDRMCYPWAIMEAKRDEDETAKTTKCYLQAVNGAAVALDMRADLYKRACGSVPETLLPVIAFTCIGPCLRVWLVWRAQSLQTRPETRMICIWATDIRLNWGAYSMRSIIENMHYWVIKNLKPELSKQLDIIRASSHRLHTAPRVRSPALTDPPRAKAFRNGSMPPPVRNHEMNASEADISHRCDNPRSTLSTPSSRASHIATSSSATSRRRNVSDSSPRAVGSDQSESEGSTTLVDEEEDEIYCELQRLTVSNAGSKGRSHSELESVESKRRSFSRGTGSQVVSREHNKKACNRSQHSDPTSWGGRISVADGDDGDLSTSEGYSRSHVGHAGQSDDDDRSNSVGQPDDDDSSSSAGQPDDDDSSSNASQSADDDECLQWIEAREAGLIEMVSSSLHGSEIMALLCSGQAPTNLDQDHMVESIELLLFRPDSGQLEAWFRHDNWDLSIEKELLEVVHLLNDSLARYSRSRRPILLGDSTDQERRTRRALHLLRIYGNPKESVSLFAALLSCYSGQGCLAALEAFNTALEDEDWGLLKQRCLDKARMKK